MQIFFRANVCINLAGIAQAGKPEPFSQDSRGCQIGSTFSQPVTLILGLCVSNTSCSNSLLLKNTHFPLIGEMICVLSG